jgi:hypothetical protein
MREVQRLDEAAGVLDLAGAAAEEAAKLALDRATVPLRLPLERAERREIAVVRENLLDRVRAEGADQLVLEVQFADVEAERLHPFARQPGAQPGALERTPELGFLGSVAKTAEP